MVESAITAAARFCAALAADEPVATDRVPLGVRGERVSRAIYITVRSLRDREIPLPGTSACCLS